MRRSLYWKILFGFWVTFVLVNQASWAIYLAFWEPRTSAERAAAEDHGRLQLDAAKAAVEFGGLPAFEHLQATWPEDRGSPLTVTSQDAAAAVPDVISIQVTAPDGAHWWLNYQLPEERPRSSGITRFFYFSSDLLIMASAGGLMFSAALAWHLTRPVQRLRKGFEQLAAGDFDTRLQPEMGGRRDEIADLANDFDRMAERLQQLVSMRDQLLHDVSHELRSPLTRLSQAIALIHQNPAHAAASLERIEKEVRRLDELVGELLSLARAESGESLRDRYFDLPELIQTVIDNAAFEAQAKGVIIDMGSVSGREGIVRGSAELMRRALENVLRNAVQVSQPKQMIEVSLATDALSNRFVVTVADEGAGVPSAKLDKMFDPFVRLDESAQSTGYGLGLAIARRAIVALGGSIEANNKKSRGLVVTITLPMHAICASA